MGSGDPRISSDYRQNTVFTDHFLGKRFRSHLIGLFVVNKLATQGRARVCSQAGSCAGRAQAGDAALGREQGRAGPPCATGMEGKAPPPRLLGETPGMNTAATQQRVLTFH